MTDDSNRIRGAIETLEQFIAEAKSWAGQREAWALICNRESAAQDRAELYRLAPREEADHIVFNGTAYREAWSGMNAGDDTKNASERRAVIRRFM